MQVVKFIPTDKNFNPRHRKENYCHAEYCVINRADIRPIITVRVYWSQSSERVYSALWIHGNQYAAGTGYAGGYGYHKGSAAVHAAFNAAGVKFDESIDGRGESAIWDAVEAVAQFLNFHDYITHKSNP